MGKKQMNNKNIKKEKKKKKKHKILRKIVLLLLLILLIEGGLIAYKVQLNGGGMTGMLATIVGHDANTKKKLGEFKVLLLGISTDQANVDLTDTIIVASYNPNTQKATLLSIPRDTYTGKYPANATAYEKINALYSRKHRPDETLTAVNEITGLNIEYYVVIKTEALIKLVDVIGGVTFNVPIDMNYDDPTQDLHIHLKKGEQLLDGDRAEQVLRFRHNNNGTSYPEEYGDNDKGRMRTQRDFIMQVIKQTAKVENIFKLGEILDVAKEYVITNIDFNVAKDYVPYVVEFNTENLFTATLPGENTNKNTSQTWIFIHNKTQTKSLIQELFFDRDLEEENEEEKLTTNNNLNATEKNSNNNTNLTNVNKATTSKTDITIEVLNGSGETEKLQKVVNQLKGAGFRVTRTGSTTTTSRTVIINKKEVKDTLIKNMKDVIGLGEVQIPENGEISSSKVDVTIIIGKDY